VVFAPLKSSFKHLFIHPKFPENFPRFPKFPNFLPHWPDQIYFSKFPFSTSIQPSNSNFLTPQNSQNSQFNFPNWKVLPPHPEFKSTARSYHQSYKFSCRQLFLGFIKILPFDCKAILSYSSTNSNAPLCAAHTLKRLLFSRGWELASSSPVSAGVGREPLQPGGPPPQSSSCLVPSSVPSFHFALFPSHFTNV
jgi:hypothetical protein